MGRLHVHFYWGLVAGLIIAALIFARPAKGVNAVWVRIPQIAAFDNRYGYEAYADRVVLIDNLSAARAVVYSGGRCPVGRSFRWTLWYEKDLAIKLGPALSPETCIYSNRLRVQVFRNGVMVIAPKTRAEWWNWHPQSRTVSNVPQPLPPSPPGTFSAPA